MERFNPDDCLIGERYASVYTAHKIDMGDRRQTGRGTVSMELFAFIGISNAEILTGAAAVFAVATASSLAVRAFRRTRGDLEDRVERLEVRLAAANALQPVLNQADELVRQVSQNAVRPVIEMFEDAPRPRSFFSTGAPPEELAAALASDLRDNVEIAAAIARPIRNMIENGSMEVSAERSRLAADIRTRADNLGSETWKTYRRALLAAGVPNRSGEAVIACFARVKDLKAAIDAMDRRPSADQMVDVLAAAASLIEAADHANTVFADAAISAASDPGQASAA